MTSISLPISEVTKNITLKVNIKGLTAFKWRLKLATALIRLASKIAGVNCEVSE